MPMRTIFVTLLALIALLPLHAQISAPDGYYYDRYDVNVTVHPDNSFTVKELIDVVFTQPSHGLYRTIPVDVWIKRDVSDHQDRSVEEMRNYHPDITDIKSSLPIKVETIDGCKDIRIGSPDKLIDGLQMIDISYTMRLEDDRVPQADLFYYSVLGASHAFTVRQFSFTITYDNPVPDEYLSQLRIYSGYEGSETTAQSLIRRTHDNRCIEYALLDVSPYTAVTIFQPLPEGYFSAPTSWRQYAAYLFMLMAVVVLLRVAYKQLTVDNQVASVVTFYPPKNLSSADLGTLIDCSVDDRDLISLIPWFANQGYLSILVVNGTTVLEKKCDIPLSAPEHQRIFFNALFASGKRFYTSKDTHQSFGKAWLSAKEKLERSFDDMLNEYDATSFCWLLLGILFAGLAICFSSAVGGAFGFGIKAMFAFLIEASVMYYFAPKAKRFRTMIVVVPVILIPFAYLGSLFHDVIYQIVRGIISDETGIGNFGPLFDVYQRDLYVSPLIFQLFLVFVFTICLFACRLSKMSDYRRHHLGEVLGLQEFIRTAEQNRLKMLLTEDGRYFYNILPYAIAFGLAGKWADKFNGLAMTPADGYDPTYDYHTLSHLDDTFNNSHMRHGIVAEESARAAAAARRAASSGSGWHTSSSHGSGGYSGGGFGGGGSRRW